MIGISVATKEEWQSVLDKFNIESCIKYPYGEYFKYNLFGEDVIFYKGGYRKTNASGSTQYMIDHFGLNKVIVVGTCAGIDDKYNSLDVFIPDKFVQWDCTVRETEPLIKDSFTVKINTNIFDNIKTGIIGTADKPVVMWNDCMDLKNNNVTIADTEAASIAYVCKLNDVECVVIKGISDYPKNENESNKEDSHQEQLNTYLKNIPIVMNNIIDNYLEFAIKNHFEYTDYKSESVSIRR